MDYSERRMRASIREIPNGVYAFEDYLEGDGITEYFIKVRSTIDVRDEYIVVDFTGSDAQTKGSTNATRGITKSCVYYVIKSIVDPDVPPNDGAFRPIKVMFIPFNSNSVGNRYVVSPYSIVFPEFSLLLIEVSNDFTWGE